MFSSLKDASPYLRSVFPSSRPLFYADNVFFSLLDFEFFAFWCRTFPPLPPHGSTLPPSLWLTFPLPPSARWVFPFSRPFFYADSLFFSLLEFEFFGFHVALFPPSPLMVRHFPLPLAHFPPPPILHHQSGEFPHLLGFFLCWQFVFFPIRFRVFCPPCRFPPPLSSLNFPPSGSLSPSPHPIPSLRWVFPTFYAFFNAHKSLFSCQISSFFDLDAAFPHPPLITQLPPSGSLSPSPHPTTSLRWVSPIFWAFFYAYKSLFSCQISSFLAFDAAFPPPPSWLISPFWFEFFPPYGLLSPSPPPGTLHRWVFHLLDLFFCSQFVFFSY